MAKINEEKFWTSRAIDPAVRDKRPYLPWYTDTFAHKDDRLLKDPGKKFVYQEFPERRFTKGQMRFLNKVIRQGDGMLIMRHVARPFGRKYGKIYAELRPDEAVVTKTTKHWHAAEEVPDPAPTRHSFPASLMKDHIERSSSVYYRSRKEDGEFDRESEYLGDHFGANHEDVHSHVHLAKYLFLPSPYHWAKKEHSHDSAFFRHNRTILAQHIAKNHTKRVPRPSTKHKWRSWEKNKRLNYAARVDVHPFARPKFKDAEVVYFVIEGCLKNDSVLSSVLDTKEKASVLSVPAVSLWDTPETNDPDFLQAYLKGRLVVIIPDGDWYVWERNKYSKGNKGAVIRQSRFLQTYLATQRIEAVVATTPRHIFEGSGGEIKGIDDFLGAGYKLSDMEVNEPTITYTEIREMLIDHTVDKGGNVAGLIRDSATLYALTTHALDGRIKVPYTTLARMVLLQGKKPRRMPKKYVTPMWKPKDDSVRVKALEAERQSVMAAIESLQSYGAITVEGGFEFDWDPFNHEFYWEHRPVITIDKEFVKPMKLQTLGKYPKNTSRAA